IVDRAGRVVQRRPSLSAIEAKEAEIGRYRHYMQKEIFEQPTAAANLTQLVAGGNGLTPALFGGAPAARVLRGVESVPILACGTSCHAGMVARYWIEGVAGLPCSVEIASEYRYRRPVASPKTLVVAVSQSGETADTLAALAHARALGQFRT